MNCLILFVLLFCCQGNNGRNPGSCIQPRQNGFGNQGGCDCSPQNEFLSENRFIPYPSGNCGCETPADNNCECR